MPAFLVTYDLNREVVRPNITGAIYKNFDWARLSESSYAVTGTSSEAVYAVLKPLLDDNDNLYVIPLKKPYSGYGPNDVNAWLERNLTY